MSAINLAKLRRDLKRILAYTEGLSELRPDTVAADAVCLRLRGLYEEVYLPLADQLPAEPAPLRQAAPEPALPQAPQAPPVQPAPRLGEKDLLLTENDRLRRDLAAARTRLSQLEAAQPAPIAAPQAVAPELPSERQGPRRFATWREANEDEAKKFMGLAR